MRAVEMRSVAAGNGPDGKPQVVAMVEPFADLLPGQRWGVVLTLVVELFKTP
jgi:hypothetical protein